ncbi:endonuclease/exonuclease/phosphatase family protein [Stenotrophomonas sp. HITSZ_GD]|uniref:endonuclease/exonuclease/phosphatase family protein n=1 Tax=Stenotrophomonas sp. HITSZ_GD TaxID=3037248 RepID=UPI00240DA9B5|nr:endonuclease/exonuclease/phosphatase family protein [Stenotrophomonas sp. HITSZ_GD]MDG2525984.1 endonuclease/exonuclease/phosphatase family protein [Stenotrophomonas sp. HITSZ_GD]
MMYLRNLMCLLCLCLHLSASAATAATSSTLRVMSFNVRTPADTEPGRRWEDRRDAMVSVIRQAQPAVIGTQELTPVQASYLRAQLPAYRMFGQGRRGGAEDEHMGVFYDARVLALVESGDFWLSPTPEVPGSMGWGDPYPRMVTWGLFERRADGRRFYLFNTHLPYREQDEPARVRSAQLLLSRIDALPKEVPVVVTGDFNSEPGSDTWRTLTAVLRAARDTAPQVDGPRLTFQDFGGSDRRQLDWILLRGFEATHFSTLDDRPGGLYPSDHYPVLAELRFPAPVTPRPRAGR